jgi:hypothetical protein
MQNPQAGAPPGSDVFRIILQAPNRASLAKAIREFGLDVDHQHPPKRPEAEGPVTIQAFVTQAQIDRLERGGLKVRVEENLSEVGRERQAIAPRGRGFAATEFGRRNRGHHAFGAFCAEAAKVSSRTMQEARVIKGAHRF